MSLRSALFSQLVSSRSFDLIVIGGGATGLGVALDASLRGFKVALFERHDFAKGTSSRATKLVHGGVRYLAQGNISLVREALHERRTLLDNAPHLAQALPFVMPSYQWWEKPFYGAGLKAYDMLAGAAGLGATEFLNQSETSQLIPNIQQKNLQGGVKYWDGQFDDARLAIALAQTAAVQGVLLINYCPVTALIHESEKLVGVQVQDAETGAIYQVQANCIVNATGVWVDWLRHQDEPSKQHNAKNIVKPSQGTHLVVDRSFMPTDHALLAPKTQDGRVLFIVPWLGSLILGTTDSARDDLSLEPRASAADVDLILSEAGKYLQRAPTRADVKSIWVGLRPLVKPSDDAGNTKAISREHTILTSRSGLITVTGGKWTTYRAMAEDVMDHAFEAKLLERRQGGQTVQHRLVGAKNTIHKISDAPGLHLYGSQAEVVMNCSDADREIFKGLTAGMIRYGARFEWVRTVEDMLARRSRLLFLDAQMARSIAPTVAKILLEETGQDPQLSQFLVLCDQYASVPCQ